MSKILRNQLPGEGGETDNDHPDKATAIDRKEPTPSPSPSPDPSPAPAKPLEAPSPAPGQQAPSPAPPPFAKTVKEGTKTERELILEREKKALETRLAEKEDELHRARNTPPPPPPTPKAPPKEESNWTFFG